MMKKKYTAPASHIKMLSVNHVFMEGMSNFSSVGNERGNGIQLVKGQAGWDEGSSEDAPSENNIWDEAW